MAITFPPLPDLVAHTLSDASVVVSWPLGTTGVALETSTTLESGSWSFVDEEFLTSDQSIFLWLPGPSDPKRLYQLRRM